MNKISVTNILENILLESAIDKITFNGVPYKMELDATEAPTKEGVRIKFTPLDANVPASKADITNLIKQRLDSKLDDINLSVSVDNDGLEESTITYLLTVQELLTLFKSAVNDKSNF